MIKGSCHELSTHSPLSLICRFPELSAIFKAINRTIVMYKPQNRLGQYPGFLDVFVLEASMGRGQNITKAKPNFVIIFADAPSEPYDFSEARAEIINRINGFITQHRSKLRMGKDQLAQHEQRKFSQGIVH